jgi:hypothetical protein
MEVGLAESVALTALGGGGGGGAGCFFLHPLATIKKASTPRTTIRLLVLLFTSCPPKSNAIYYKTLSKAPIGLAIAALARQLLQVRAVRQNAPDLFIARAVGLEHNVPPIRRP